jgi:hypothetical protein
VIVAERPAGGSELLVPPSERLNTDVRRVFVLQRAVLPREEFFGIEGAVEESGRFGDAVQSI